VVVAAAVAVTDTQTWSKESPSFKILHTFTDSFQKSRKKLIQKRELTTLSSKNSHYHYNWYKWPYHSNSYRFKALHSAKEVLWSASYCWLSLATQSNVPP